MSYFKQIMLSTTVIVALLASGCASQSQLTSLQADVDAMRQMSAKASSNANQALQETALLKNELAAVRQSSDSASADAAATRKLLEQMNERFERGSGSSSFK